MFWESGMSAYAPFGHAWSIAEQVKMSKAERDEKRSRLWQCSLKDNLTKLQSRLHPLIVTYLVSSRETGALGPNPGFA